MIKTITSQEDFQAVVNEPAALVDFFATWCGPCKMMHPVLESASEKLEGQVTVAEIDVDKFQDIAGQFRVMSIPTLIYFSNGKAVAATQGYQDEARLLDFIKQAQAKA